MIRKLRRKFILIMMSTVTLLLTVIFFSLYYSARLNYENQGYEQLRAAARENLPTQMSPRSNPHQPESADAPGTIPPSDNAHDANNLHPLDSNPDSNSLSPSDEKALSQTPPSEEDSPEQRPDRNETPLLVIDQSMDGTLSVVKNQLVRFEAVDAEGLVALADAVGSPNGLISEQHLRFLKEDSTPGRSLRYVFADTSSEERSLHSQLIHSLVIGAAAFAAFFLFSILLSRWITAPVEEAWNRQNRFVADASHELKTPLTVILANIGLLAKSSADFTANDRTSLSHIQAEATRMKQLTESLLTLARSDSGQSVTDFRPLDLSYLTDSCILTFEPVAFEMGKTISSQISTDIYVNGDTEKLRRLITILLDNACKYSSPESEISISLERGQKESSLLKRNSPFALLTVTSEGTPLTDEEIEHIFLRFYHTDPSRGTISGYRLGLSIAQTIVDEHHGQIRAVSDGINRNTFSVSLPIEL